LPTDALFQDVRMLHILILHVLQIKILFLRDLYVNVKTSSMSEPVRPVFAELFTKAKTSVRS